MITKELLVDLQEQSQANLQRDLHSPDRATRKRAQYYLKRSKGVPVWKALGYASPEAYKNNYGVSNKRKHERRVQGFASYTFYTPEGYDRQLVRARAYQKLRRLTDPTWAESERQRKTDYRDRMKRVYGGNPNQVDSAHVKFKEHQFLKRTEDIIRQMKARIHYGTVTREFGERRVRELKELLND